jgi:hypothetical protein
MAIFDADFYHDYYFEDIMLLRVFVEYF